MTWNDEGDLLCQKIDFHTFSTRNLGLTFGDSYRFDTEKTLQSFDHDPVSKYTFMINYKIIHFFFWSRLYVLYTQTKDQRTNT